MIDAIELNGKVVASQATDTSSDDSQPAASTQTVRKQPPRQTIPPLNS